MYQCPQQGVVCHQEFDIIRTLSESLKGLLPLRDTIEGKKSSRFFRRKIGSRPIKPLCKQESHMNLFGTGFVYTDEELL